VAEAVRQAHHARHHVVANGNFHRNRPGGRADLDQLAVLQVPLAEVVGVHQQLVSRLALHQAGRVVHPGVVAAQVPSPDQQQLVGLTLDEQHRPSLVQTLEDQPRRKVDPLVLRVERLRQSRLQRTEIDTAGRLLQLPHRQPVRPDAKPQIDHAARAQPEPKGGQQLPPASRRTA
jgi:hypothetical protein